MFEQSPIEAFNSLDPILVWGVLTATIIVDRIVAKKLTGSWLGWPGRYPEAASEK
jgi:hypothetical protein